MNTRTSAFTLIELLITITIVGMLATLLVPAVGKLEERARTAKCANNLQVIGVAVQEYANDNDDKFPTIEAMPSNPVYSSSDNAGTLVSTLGSYGVTKAVVQCPSDLRRHNYYAQEGSSYMWFPVVDGEPVSAPKIYGFRGGPRVPRSAWIRICTDYDGSLHAGHSNRLYADGHVKASY
jgi:prepilin-type N-terminal cleavage/methylation domain-containing protein/prepilin-type processing-associated H-X9-DG protein